MSEMKILREAIINTFTSLTLEIDQPAGESTSMSFACTWLGAIIPPRPHPPSQRAMPPLKVHVTNCELTGPTLAPRLKALVAEFCYAYLAINCAP